MGGRLLSSYRTVFELPQSLPDSKTSDFSCSNKWDTCPGRIIDRLAIYQDKVFAAFLCVLPFSSVLGRFIYLYYNRSSLGRSNSRMGDKALFFSRIRNIFAVAILSKAEENSQPYRILSTVFKSYKSKNLINSWHFLKVFWMHSLLSFDWHPQFPLIKGVIVVHILAKFHWYRICSFRLLNFKFFWPVTKYKMMHQTCYTFYWSI